MNLKRGKILKKYKMKIIAIFCLTVIVFCNITNVSAVIYKPDLPVSTMSSGKDLNEFPESYRPYLKALKDAHPNWVFKAVNTGLDWNIAVKHESYETKMGISTLNTKDYDSYWFYSGSNGYWDGSYYTASKGAVAYFLDPRNHLTEKYIFQFSTLAYTDTQTVSSVDNTLRFSWMGKDWYKTRYQYKTKDNWVDMGKSYAELIYQIGKDYGVNPSYIASKILSETSGDICNNGSINGINSTYPGYYNFLNRGAIPDGDGNNSVLNGLKYSAQKGFNTPDKSIRDGVDLLKNKYIKWGQDTVYFQKFDVNNPYDNAVSLFESQYATNLNDSRLQASLTYQGLSKDDLKRAFEFHIPVYNNMPSTACPEPSSEGIYFNDDNTVIYLDDPSDKGVNDVFPIRSYANTASDLLVTWVESTDNLADRTHFIRTGIGVNTIYDQIKLPDGRTGYVLKKWIYEYKNESISSISIDKTEYILKEGESLNLVPVIKPDDAKNKNYKVSISNTDIIEYKDGKVVAKKSGESTITFTPEARPDISAKAKIVVKGKVSGITMDKDEYILLNSSTTELKPKILPVNAYNQNYTATVADENIAVYKDGKITTKKVGETTITFTTEEGKFTKTVKIIVKDAYFKIKDNKYNLNNNVMSKINPKTSIKDFKQFIDTNMELTFTKIDGTKLNDNDLIGTGTKVSLKSKDGILYEYKFLIYGDISGDGEIDSLDILILRSHLLAQGEGSNNLTGIQYDSCNVSKTDFVVDSLDILILRNYLLNGNGITQ